MIPPSIFVEGPTEERVLAKLCHRTNISEQDLLIESVRGKKNLWGKAAISLEPDIGSGERRAILFLRDNDADDKGIATIVGDFQQNIEHLLQEHGVQETVSFQQPIVQHPNIFSYTLLIPERVDIRVLIHIAEPPTLPLSLDGYPFDNATTDHYILAAALIDAVIQRFATEDAGIVPTTFVNKVLHELPDLLRANGMKDIGVKDIISCYMTTARFLKVKGSEKKELFASIVLDRAWTHAKNEYQHIFASHIAAISLLTQKEYTT